MFRSVRRVGLVAMAVAGLALASSSEAHAWGRGRVTSPAYQQYTPGYGWTYPSSPALYGYAPFGYYADYGTYFRGVPMDGWNGQHTWQGSAAPVTYGDHGYGFSNYGFGAYSGSTGYPSIGYNGLDGAPALPAGYGAGN